MVLRYEPPLYESAPPFFYVLWKKPPAASYLVDPKVRGLQPPEAVVFSRVRVFSWMGSGA
jgi:hypothetical protein